MAPLPREFPRFLVAIALIAGLAAVSIAPASAQEWTRFRGPNGTGVSKATTIPTSWTDKDYLFNVELPGVGVSSPVVWKEKLFVTSADTKTGTRMVHCRSTKDGSKVWQKDFASTTHHTHGQNALASSTPAVDADAVYIAWATPEEYTVLALDHTGKELWRKNLGPFVSQHGFGTSPMLYKDLVILTNDQEGPSFLVAFDRKSGEEKWKTTRPYKLPQSASYSTPCLYEPAGGKPQLIVCSWLQGICGVDPDTGKIEWEEAVFPLRPVSQPIVVGSLVYGTCGAGSGDNTFVALKPGSASQKPEVAYTIDKSAAPYVPSPVALGDLIFLWNDKGVVTCIEAASGDVKWKKRIAGGNYSSSPIIVGDRLYNFSAEGEVVVLTAKAESEELARFKLPEGTRATPAVSDGRMFLRTYTRLMAVGK